MARKINPNEPRVYGVRGQILGAQKGLSAALEDLHQAVVHDPASAYGYGVKGEVIASWNPNLGPTPAEFRRLQQYHPDADLADLVGIAALGNLRDALQRDPDNPRYHCDLGAALAHTTDNQRSIQELDLALELNPNFVRAYQERMQLKVRIHDFKGADADAVRLIELTPSSFWGHHAHGGYLQLTGNWDEAIKEISLAIQLQPDGAARDYTARAMYRLGHEKFSEAVADATAALELDPHQLNARMFRGVALFELKQWQKAVADFDVLLRVAPAYADYWTYRGEAKLAMGDVKGAARDFSEALKLSPHLANATYKRGICRLEMDDLEGAAADFRDALDQPVARNYFGMGFPGDAAAHWGLGQVLARQGKLKESLAEFDETLRLWPGYVRVLTCRGMVRHWLHDDRGALDDFNRVLEESPRDHVTYLRRGYVKLDLADRRRALTDFNAALKIRPAYAPAYLGRATVKLALDDGPGALADLDTAAAQAVAETRRARQPHGGHNARRGRHDRGDRCGRHQQPLQLPGRSRCQRRRRTCGPGRSRHSARYLQPKGGGVRQDE